MAVAPAPSSPLEVTVLGSADAFASGGCLYASYLFRSARSTFLVDCGPTVLAALKRRQIDTAQLDFVVVSHLHGDHFGGIPFLLLEYMYERPRARPLDLIGPPGIGERVWDLFRALYRDLERDALGFEIRFHELVPERPLRIADATILGVQVPHQVEDVSLALRFEIAGKRVLYSGDSPWTERFVELAEGADLFLCECTSYERSMGRHITYQDLRLQLPRLRSRRLVLIHLGREMREHAAEIGAECATDGLVLAL